MNSLYSLALIAATVASISESTPIQAVSDTPTTIETKTAIVTTDTTEGNYFEFLDKTGGWWLKSDGEHPTFEIG